MYTVGAPHTWPQIVAALIWLTDCFKVAFEFFIPNISTFQAGILVTDVLIVFFKFPFFYMRRKR